MSSDLWDEAMSAEPGTKSVTKEIGQIGRENNQSFRTGIESDVVIRRSNKISSPGQEAWGGSNGTVPEQQPQCLVGETGIVPSYGQQTAQFIENTNNEKKLRSAIKDQEKFRKEDAFEFEKAQARHRLSTTPIYPLPEMMSVNVPFPVHVFPYSARKYIEDFSSAYGRHQCAGGAMLLGVVSIAANGKFKVRRHAEHVELMTLYQMLMMSSGKFKSPMKTTAFRAIKKLEKRLQDEFLEKKERVQIERAILQKRIKYIETQAAKKGDIKAAVEEIAKLRDLMPEQASFPQLVVFNKFTPEGLEKMVAQQNGNLALVGDELGSFKKLPANKDDMIVKAWEGGSYVYGKMKDAIQIDDSCLTVCIATQEATSIKFLGNEAFQEDGLVSRFMLVVPPDLNHPTPGGVLTTELAQEDNEWLEKVVNDIYSIPRAEEGHHLLKFQDGVLRSWDSFYHYTQQQAEDDNNSVLLQSWYRKLAGTALRFSGFLHLLCCMESDLPVETGINQADVDGGIELARFYEAHAQVALDLNGNDVLRTANKFIKRIRELGRNEVTQREIYRPEHVKANNAHKAFQFLAERGYVALLRHGKSDICLVNPSLWTMPMTN